MVHKLSLFLEGNPHLPIEQAIACAFLLVILRVEFARLRVGQGRCAEKRLGLAQLLHAFVQRRLTRAAVFAVALLASWLLLMVGLS